MTDQPVKGDRSTLRRAYSSPEGIDTCRLPQFSDQRQCQFCYDF